MIHFAFYQPSHPAVEFDPSLPDSDDLLSIFLNDTPLLDVRAPVEFAEGAFPGSINRPLIDDEQRHVIGKQYKDQGQDAAIQLGLTLMTPDLREQRVQDWQTFAQQNPDGLLYCFRGGMRSKISQQWLADSAGIRYPRVKGGYKALRRFLIDQLSDNAQQMRPIVVGGRTGCGKTRFLNTLTPNLDLEGIFWHRGSAFGNHATAQPPQITLENRLSIALLKLVHQGNPYFVSEDEGRNIGARHIPLEFFEPFSKAPVVVLEASLEERIDITFQEYVVDTLAEHQALHGEEQGFQSWADYLLNSMDRIRKRLGGERHLAVREELSHAVEKHRSQGDTDAHRQWIETLLTDYYDAMYQYQLSKKQDRICFTGNKQEVSEFLAQEYSILSK